MSKPAPEQTIFAQELLRRKVLDAGGRDLGRVYELEAEDVGGELRVTALLIGPGAWITRFGWTGREHGRRVPWEEIASLSPHISLRLSTTE